MEEGCPLYLVINAISKERNFGNLLRTAVAFGAREILVCGGNARQCCEGRWGAKGADRFMPLRTFARLSDAKEWLRERGVSLVGIEITPEARAVGTHPFHGPTAFMPGNEGDGLSDSQKSLCDSFVYIPHFGNGTASLNVAAATAVVLSHFSHWASTSGQPGWVERAREPGKDKYLVEAPVWTGELSPAQAALREAREATRMEASAPEGVGFGGGAFEAEDE